jgi:hypothetical protein
VSYLPSDAEAVLALLGSTSYDETVTCGGEVLLHAVNVSSTQQFCAE